MKIQQIRAVEIDLPRIPPQSKPRRPSWNTHARRALPISKYPEFSRLPDTMPGANTRADVWVQVISEDGTWGLGQCSFGEPTAALVNYHFGPLVEGRDCMALEYLNDLMWRSSQRIWCRWDCFCRSVGHRSRTVGPQGEASWPTRLLSYRRSMQRQSSSLLHL